MRRIPTTRQQHADDRRSQILDAATEVFGCKGFAGTTIRDIARRIGVTEGLLYHYFESKDELLHACFQERSFHAELEKIISRSKDVPMTDVLREIVGTLLFKLRSHGALVRMMTAEMLHRVDCAREFHERIEENRVAISGFLRDRQKLGEVRADAVLETVADLLMGAAQSAFLIYGSLPDDEWAPVADGLIRHGVDTVVYGLATPQVRNSVACQAHATEI